jgi:hypothetical protein
MATHTAEDIDHARKLFIQGFVGENGGRKALKHLGEMLEQDLPQDSIDFYKSKIKGDESKIEFHLFEIIQGGRKGTQMITQWRLRPGDECRLVATVKH